MADTVASRNESREIRIGRILSDLHERRARGERINAAATLAAHPDLADELRPYLVVLDELCSARGDLDGLIAQGTLSRSADPKYPACLDSYKVIEFIGRGGMGVVLKAHDESLSRPIALKILRPELASDAAALQRFHREAKAAAALRHPNIVTVHAVGEERGVHYIAMEYIDGPTLAEVIREHGPLAADAVRNLFSQLLAGLAAAHAANLIHRDIKSANLLIDKSLRPWSGGSPDPDSSCAEAAEQGPACSPSAVLKIADFGLARVLSAETRLTIPQSAFGTPEYMSPEQARGDDDIDHRSDLYSAGVVLYEMLTSRTPFHADTPTAVIHRILHEDPVDPRKLAKSADPALSSLALRLMAKRPEDRLASAGEAMAALDAARRIGSPERRRRRHRVLTVVLMSAFLASIVAVWLGHRIMMNPRAITGVHVDPLKRTRVLARGEDGREWPFAEFPVETLRVRIAELIDLDGQGRKAIVAGLQTALDGAAIFAFQPDGSELWRMDISDSRRWPDCAAGSESKKWCCGTFLNAELDGLPGDELVVIASEPDEYPTRVSIVDPRGREIRATFWHTGDLENAWLSTDFFGAGRPAIIAWGYNNKLDGFASPEADDPARLTQWDKVCVVMILDPGKMLKLGEGLGPPFTARLGIPPMMPFCYAFLDLPPAAADGPLSNGANGRIEVDSTELAGIPYVNPSPSLPDEATKPWLHICVSRREDLAGVGLTVDRNLNIQRVLTGPGNDPKPEAYWREHWRPIIQEGRYVE